MLPAFPVLLMSTRQCSSTLGFITEATNLGAKKDNDAADTLNKEGKHSIQKPAHSSRRRLLIEIAPEILLLVADNLPSLSDLNSLARTSRYLYKTINRTLYKQAVVQIRSSMPILPGRWNRILHGGERFLIPRLQCFLSHGLPIELRFRSYQLFTQGTLLLACTSLSEQAALLLIEAGADVNAKDSAGLTPLREAVWKGDRALVEILLDCGADINEVNEWDLSPLEMAVMEEVRALVELLWARGAPVEDWSPRTLKKFWSMAAPSVGGDTPRDPVAGGVCSNLKQEDDGRELRRDSGVGEEVRGAEREMLMGTEMQVSEKAEKPGEEAFEKSCGELEKAL